MVKCSECNGNCDPGEIVGGVCLDCMEQKRQMQIRQERAFRVMTSLWVQTDFMEVLNGKTSQT